MGNHPGGDGDVTNNNSKRQVLASKSQLETWNEWTLDDCLANVRYLVIRGVHKSCNAGTDGGCLSANEPAKQAQNAR